MKTREFKYVGDPIPELNGKEHAAFLFHLQKAILFSLEKRELLTHSQLERCLSELEKNSKNRNIKKHQNNKTP